MGMFRLPTVAFAVLADLQSGLLRLRSLLHARANHGREFIRGRGMPRIVVIALTVIFLAAPAAQAKEWAREMFATTTHDFGHVARGAKAEFAFELQNIFEEDIHIADVRTSCGCATPTITQPTLKTWEKGAIVATLNTRSYLGHRSSTLTVVIDKPYYAEVHLNISGNIHSDVAFDPGSISFGDVEQGRSAEQQVTVTYRGRSAWQIADVRSANDALEVELSEPIRQLGQISYRMTVRLKSDAEAGTLQDQLTLVTNDQRMPTVQLAVEGRISPPLSISPSPLFFGTLQPGQTATKQLVITGRQPFRVTSIVSDSPLMDFKAATDVLKKVHLVPVVLTAGQSPGEFQSTITVKTDLPAGGKATITARGTVAGEVSTPEASAASNPSRTSR
jgi:hypothetical protein